MAGWGSKGERALQERFGTFRRAQAFHSTQFHDRLNARMREFVARQEMAWIATAAAGGECDCSFRAGPPGFVRVLDERTLVYPEYRGNGVMASLGNISENPHVAMIFIDFLDSGVGLHVNGRAAILENAELSARPGLPREVALDLQAVGGLRCERWVRIDVEEAFIHCTKHIPLMEKRAKAVPLHADDVACKGGNYFKDQASPSAPVGTKATSTRRKETRTRDSGPGATP